MTEASSGHAGEDELQVVEAIESAIRTRLDLDLLLDLGQLYLEPTHREAEALGIFIVVMALEPSNGRACVGCAYTALHCDMTESALVKAAQLLRSIAEAGPTTGVSLMLLAEVEKTLGGLQLDDEIKLLERSVRADPDWVSNRRRLARAYAVAGRRREALDQIDRAICNLLPETARLTLIEESYHTCFTGRLDSLEDLQEDRARIDRSAPG